jgi:hypothetical protein
MKHGTVPRWVCGGHLERIRKAAKKYYLRRNTCARHLLAKKQRRGQQKGGARPLVKSYRFGVRRHAKYADDRYLLFCFHFEIVFIVIFV